MILGSGEFQKLFGETRKKVSKNLSVYSNRVGNILIGTPPLTTTQQCFSMNIKQDSQKLSFKKLFGDTEDISFSEDNHSDAELAEAHFKSTIRHNGTRYVSKIPWRPHAVLGKSHDLAFSRLKSTHKRFKKDENNRKAHVEQINELIKSGYIVPAKRSEIKYFIPHLIVSKETSLTTKHRLVMDFSMKNRMVFHSMTFSFQVAE